MESPLDPYLAAHPDATPRLNAALLEVQKVMKAAKKDSVNPFFSTDSKKSLYADLGSILEACLPHLTAHGLAIAQTASNDVNGVTVITHLRHVSGECLSSPFWVPVVKKDPQGYGSASTYARRFGLQALVGLAAEADDDGNSHHVDPKAKTAKDYAKPAKSPEVLAEAAHDAVIDKLVKAFSGLGVPVAHLEDRIGHPLVNATPAEIADLRAYFKKKKELANADPDEVARLEVQRQSEIALAAATVEERKRIDAQIKQLDGPPQSVEVRRNAAFKTFSENIAEAKSAALVTLALASAPNEKLFGSGELKALQRAADNRIKILNDAGRVLPPPTADVPF